jgi:hypothetical protein
LGSYEYFAGGKLITVFSARDYCNRIRNSGAMLEISRELSILPKVIHTKFEESSTLYAPLLPPLNPRRCLTILLGPSGCLRPVCHDSLRQAHRTGDLGSLSGALSAP